MIKSNLPDSIVKNGLTYIRNYDYFTRKLISVDTENVEKQIQQAKKYGLKYITIQVLHRNLRGRQDLHNKDYQPRTYVFVCEKKSIHDSKGVYGISDYFKSILQ